MDHGDVSDILSEISDTESSYRQQMYVQIQVNVVCLNSQLKYESKLF